MLAVLAGIISLDTHSTVASTYLGMDKRGAGEYTAGTGSNEGDAAAGTLVSRCRDGDGVVGDPSTQGICCALEMGNPLHHTK